MATALPESWVGRASTARFLPWRDVLHEGPVSAQLPLATLRICGAHFLADKGWAELETAQAQMIARDRLLASAADFDRIVLWFEHDLFDQCSCCQILSWFADHDRGRARLDMLCIESFPGLPDFGWLGELAPERMASLRGREQPVSAAQLALAKAGVRGVRSGRAAAACRDSATRDSSPLPHLRPALARMLEEYPWQGDGLARSPPAAAVERQDLRRRSRAMFRACTHMEERALSRRRHLPRLCRRSRRGVGTGTPFHRKRAAEDSSPWQQLVLLTRFGERLLRGAADFVAANGINRWIGGVHLARDCWRYNPTTKTVLPTGID
jgi:hypothetical protein